MNKRRMIEAHRQGCADTWGASVFWKKGSSAPIAAAEVQGQYGERLATQQNYANRPTIDSPFGGTSWETSQAIDPATGQPVTSWKQNVNLTPEQQAALESQQNIQQGRSQAAESLLGQATGAFETPFDWESMPERAGSISGAQQGAYEKMSAMLEPGRTREREALNTRMANMGLPIGSEAYNREQGRLADQFAQQDKSVLAQSLGEGRADASAQEALRQSAVAEEIQRRGMPLSELDQLLTGQQVGMPGMPNAAPNAAAGQVPDFVGAANASQAAKAAQRGEIGQAAGTAAMMYAMYMGAAF